MESGLYDVSGYDALQLRVRGDGRRFIANVSAPGMGRKDDIWQAFVFTRGGPEWEDITVSSQYLNTKKILLPNSITVKLFLLAAVFRVFPDQPRLHAGHSDAAA